MAREYTITPTGILVYGVLSEPSFEYKQNGEYLAKVRFREEDLEVIKKAYKAHIEEAKEMAIKTLSSGRAKKPAAPKRGELPGKGDPANPGKAPSRGKKPEAPKRGELPWKEDPENPGWFTVNFKKAYSGKKDGREWTSVLPMFKANGSPIEGEAKGIWNGSEVSVAFFPVPYFKTNTVGYGVTMKLGAVQVIRAQYGAAQTAAAFGFASSGEPDDESGTEDEDYDTDDIDDTDDMDDGGDFDTDSTGDEEDDDIPFDVDGDDVPDF